MTHEQNWGASPSVSAPTSIGTDGTRGITETRALMAVLEKILETEPTARVSAVKVQSLNIEKTFFVVTATRARGRLGDQDSIYRVAVDAAGVLVITPIAEQG